MRGAAEPQTTLFGYVSVEGRIPADHPLCTIHALINANHRESITCDAPTATGKR